MAFDGYIVVSINYRLGLITRDDPTVVTRDPDQPVAETPNPALRNAHPTQIEDCARALKWVMDNIDRFGGNPHQIAVTGISAGAISQRCSLPTKRFTDNSASILATSNAGSR